MNPQQPVYQFGQQQQMFPQMNMADFQKKQN